MKESLDTLDGILQVVAEASSDQQLREIAEQWRSVLGASKPSLLGLLVTSDGLASTFGFEFGEIDEAWSLPGLSWGSSPPYETGEVCRLYEGSFTILYASGRGVEALPINTVATYIATSPWSPGDLRYAAGRDFVQGDVIFVGYDEGNDDAFLLGLDEFHLDGICRVSLALNPECPPEALAALADQARGDEVSHEILAGRGTRLVTEPWNRLVRLAVARNPAAPVDIVRALVGDS